jgi:hypothetical protein
MHQFTYEITCKRTGRVERARCTAPRADWARLQLQLVYEPQFAIAELYCDIDPPHRTLGEIDAADMTAADAKHCIRELAEPGYLYKNLIPL